MSGYFKELVSFNVYKAQQGRRARRLSFIGFSLVFIFGAYALYSNYHTQNAGIAAVIIALLGIWISYRTINFPTFADFLVSVEAEMSKVSWPTRAELWANSKVVLLFMFLFTVLIYLYDIIFNLIFSPFL
ncbi:MAG: preprotein translocase subunit SecE [Thermoguttaceae bacterium]|nr:preprotein translocase subunit SecE [Thermoguttaceae bacterium]